MNAVKYVIFLVMTGTFFYAGLVFIATDLHADDFVIVYSNDILGELELCGCDSEQLGGLARKATLLQSQQKQGRQVLVLDAGNLFFKEEPVSHIDEKEFLLKSEYILAAYKQLKCDALNVGEADLHLGIARLKNLQKQAGFPFLSANLVDKKSGRPVFEPFIIKQIAGVQVGIVGLFSDQTPVEPSLSVKNPLAVARDSIVKIRPRCDLVIVLSNLGNAHDRELARNVSGIDLIIGSRATTKMTEPVKEGNTLIVNAYNRGQYVGKLDVKAKSASKKMQVTMQNQLIPLGEDIADDKPIATLAKEYRARLIAMNRQEFFKERLNEKKAIAAGEELYVGADKCGSCHQPQYENWQYTPHANAYETLMRNCNNFDIECLPCHTTGFREPGGYNINQGDESSLVNVQCESCHGPGKKHVGKGDIVRDAGEGVCKQCHDEKNSPRFHYEDYLSIVKCPATTSP